MEVIFPSQIISNQQFLTSTIVYEKPKVPVFEIPSNNQMKENPILQS